MSGHACSSSALGAAAGRGRHLHRLRTVEPTAARPRRAYVPRGLLRGPRLRDLEQQLVRRPLPPLLQRAVPAAGCAAHSGLGGRCRRCFERLAVRPPGARALGRRRRVGRTLVRAARRGRAACERVAGRSRSASPSAWARCARCRRGGRWSPAPSQSAVRWPARWPRRSLRWSARQARSYSARRGALLGVVAAALIPLSVLGILFPESGEFPFWFSAWWPLALFCALALAATRGEEEDRDVRLVVAVYLALGDAVCPAAESARRQHDPPGLAVRGTGAAGDAAGTPASAPGPAGDRRAGGGPCLAGGHAGAPDGESLDDPATERAYYEPLVAWLDERSAQRERIEIPQTFNHWETAYVSPRFSLARGWLRQLDLERNRIFYEGEPTHASYRRWLHDKGIRYVAASDARLDYSAQDEDRLVREEPPYLRLRARLPHWRVYEVVGAQPLLTQVGAGRASLAGLTPESFDLSVERAGTFVVRVRHTPYWDGGPGVCVGKAGNWTLVRVSGPGHFPVRARFGAEAAWRARGEGPKSAEPHIAAQMRPHFVTGRETSPTGSLVFDPHVPADRSSCDPAFACRDPPSPVEAHRAPAAPALAAEGWFRRASAAVAVRDGGHPVRNGAGCRRVERRDGVQQRARHRRVRAEHGTVLRAGTPDLGDGPARA